MPDATAPPPRADASDADASDADAGAAEAARTAAGVLERIDDAVVALDRRWRCRYANRAAARLFESVGVAPADVLGAVPWEAAPGLFIPCFEREARRAAAEDAVTEYEEVHPATGRAYHVRIHPGPDGVTVAARDVTERRAAERAQTLLRDAARLLATSRELDATLHELTLLLVPAAADYCLVYLVDDDGTAHQTAYRHVDPEKEALLAELKERWRPGSATPGSATVRALQTTAPVLVPEATLEAARAVIRDPEVLRIYEELAPVSYIVVPLVARDRTIGTIVLACSVSGRCFGESDAGLAELVGARAALAIDNARLWTEAQRARDRALHVLQLEAQLAQARLDALRAQLNPHFLFNTLNTLAMLVRRGANDDALRGIIELSALLRQVLQTGGVAETQLGEELRLAERYLEIEQLRFHDRLQVQLSVPAEALDAYLPTMLLQPLVENAVKHGVARTRGPVRVEISASCREGRLSIEVRDDGPGLPDGWELDTSQGIGLGTTRDRLRQFYGAAHRFDVRRGPHRGAVVTIEIPFSRTPRLQLGAAAHGGRRE